VRFQALFPALFIAMTLSAPGQESRPAPVTCVQLLAWSAGEISSQRLNRLAHERGIAFSLDSTTSDALVAAGVEPRLLQELRTAPADKPDASGCPASLVRAGELVRQKKYQEAQPILQSLIAEDPKNAALHFALGSVHQQQGDWDDASNSYENAEDLMPGLADVHSRLAYLLYRSDDGDAAIAEARTALSIDPRNAEAYRFLGLGLYATGKYSAAAHAFQESLARQPNNADVYYDMGITLRDKGDVDAAAAAYRKAIALNPGLWEAHNNLGMVLHDLKSYDGAIAEYKEAKRLAPGESVVRSNLGNT